MERRRRPEPRPPAEEAHTTAALPPAEEALVLGGGLLGASVARYAASQRMRVVVGSRTPRAHAGLWRYLDLERPPPRLFTPDARVFVCVAPAERASSLWSDAMPRLVEHAWRMRVRSVTVCGPVGSGARGLDAFLAGAALLDPRTSILRIAGLFGVGDRLLQPLVEAGRDRGVVRVPRGLPAGRPLWVEDAARAAWRLGAGDHALLGSERLTYEELAEAVAATFAGRAAGRLFGGREHRERLLSLEGLPDPWDEDLLGKRTTVSEWLARLPDARRPPGTARLPDGPR